MEDRLSVLVDVQYALKQLKGGLGFGRPDGLTDRVTRAIDALERAEEALQREPETLDEILADCVKLS